MTSYSVAFKPSVEKDLHRLPAAVRRRVLARVEELTFNPFPRQVIKLTGAERLYRVRAGDYRIVFEVDTATRTILVHHVRHRRDAYRSP